MATTSNMKATGIKIAKNFFCPVDNKFSVFSRSMPLSYVPTNSKLPRFCYATSTNFFFILCTVLMPTPSFFAIIRMEYPFRSCLMTPAYSSCNFSSDFRYLSLRPTFPPSVIYFSFHGLCSERKIPIAAYQSEKKLLVRVVLLICIKVLCEVS